MNYRVRKLALLFLLSIYTLIFNANVLAKQPLDQGIVVAENRADIALYSQQALSQVFVKLSGYPDIVNNQTVSRSITNFEQYLISSRFLQENDQLLFAAQFNQQKILALLSSLELPIWTDLRPSAIVWLGYREGQGFQYVTELNNSAFKNILKLASRSRGVELLLPLGDLSDNMNIKPYDVWSQNISKLQSQTYRYPVDNLLSISINELTKQDIERLNIEIERQQLELMLNAETIAFRETDVGITATPASVNSTPMPEKLSHATKYRIDFIFILSGQTIIDSMYGESLDEALNGVIDNYADQLAQRFAVVAKANRQSVTTELTMQNVTSLRHLMEIQNLLENNPLIRSLNLIKQSGSLSVFEVEITDSTQKVIEILTIDPRITVLDSTNKEPQMVNLQWNLD